MPNPQQIIAGLAALGLAAAALATVPNAAEAGPEKTPTTPLAYAVKDIDGKDVSLAKKYKGKVVLIVNTASKCGYTPQYAGLESLYQKYKEQGFTIAAFPANNFGAQEPGANNEIKEFCTGKYNTTFDLYSKISVKGADQAPLYQFLTGKTTNPKFAGDIPWNFTKFLVGRDGKVIARFEPGKEPLSPEVTQAVEAALAAKK